MYLDNEECLYEIPDVFFCGHGTAQSKELGQFVVVDFLTGVVDQVVGDKLEGFDIAQAITLLDVLGDNGVNETLYIGPLVADVAELRKTAAGEIVGKGSLEAGLGFGRYAAGVDAVVVTVFCEGKGIEPDFVVASGQMGGQFAAEQFCVGSGDKDVEAGSQQTIDKEMPAFDILYLVEENIIDILTV